MGSLDCPIKWNKNTAVEEEELDNGVEKYIEEKRRYNSESESKVTNNSGERNLVADAILIQARLNGPSLPKYDSRWKFSCMGLADQWGLIGIKTTMEGR